VPVDRPPRITSAPDIQLEERNQRAAHGFHIVDERPVPQTRENLDLRQREVPLLPLRELHLNERINVIHGL
jgi:hypothetical protein